MGVTAWVTRGSRVAGVLLVAGTNALSAQRVSIAPNIGVYIPTTELVKAANGQEFKQEISITLGGRLPSGAVHQARGIPGDGRGRRYQPKR
jgi:hypothetical protein